MYTCTINAPIIRIIEGTYSNYDTRILVWLRCKKKKSKHSRPKPLIGLSQVTCKRVFDLINHPSKQYKVLFVIWVPTAYNSAEMSKSSCKARVVCVCVLGRVGGCVCVCVCSRQLIVNNLEWMQRLFAVHEGPHIIIPPLPPHPIAT